MDPNAFDRISKQFAHRRLTRRDALLTSRMAVDADQEEAPEIVAPEPWNGEKQNYLFVQSFHSGSITPSEHQDGRYTVTLEQGTGQTIYFANRPSREVGVTDTPEFFAGLGFPEDNPPNAAMILETAPGETDTAVVELFNPTIEPDTGTVTYDVEVLMNWRNELEFGFHEDPTALAELAPEFGTAHLLIDDCPNNVTVWCNTRSAIFWGIRQGGFFPIETCYNWIWCMPCEPYGTVQPDKCATTEYWTKKCNDTFPSCAGECRAFPDNYAIDPC